MLVYQRVYVIHLTVNLVKQKKTAGKVLAEGAWHWNGRDDLVSQTFLHFESCCFHGNPMWKPAKQVCLEHPADTAVVPWISAEIRVQRMSETTAGHWDNWDTDSPRWTFMWLSSLHDWHHGCWATCCKTMTGKHFLYVSVPCFTLIFHSTSNTWYILIPFDAAKDRA